MLSPLRLPAHHRLPGLPAAAVAAFAVSAALVLPIGTPSAQEPWLHLNPAIEKLAAGKPIFGIQTGDLSMFNARAMARVDTDFVYFDMEHTPLNMEGLAVFVAGMNDKAYTLKKGNAQPRSALIARFPPYASDRAGWIVKQALDIGLMGFLFNTVDTKEDALFAVKSMRYPPWKARASAYKGPLGVRGWSPTTALWVWGIDAEDYRRRADIWPLNPEGDLLPFFAIETQEGVKNVNEIAQVPGVSILHAAAGGDLSSSYGVPNNSPEVEAARQQILKACKTYKVICSISQSGKEGIERRIKEGWQVIRSESGTAER